MPLNELNYTVDQILAQILTDYQNQSFYDADGRLIQPDTSKGSQLHMEASALAALSWRIRQEVKYLLRQIHPDTQDNANLIHSAGLRNLTLRTGETVESLKARLLELLRNPDTGGNETDFERWAKEVAKVKSADCYSLARGDGTLDMVIFADPALNGGSETPGAELLAAVEAHLLTKRPAGTKDLDVVPPTFLPTDVTMTISGTNVDAVKCKADIEAFLDSFASRQVLHLNELIYHAVANGATTSIAISEPVADVTPNQSEGYETIRKGTVTVNVV